MGPTLGLVIVMFVVIAAVLIGTLLFMPGWKSAVVLFAVYAAGLTFATLTPAVMEGQMNRAAAGLAWIALVLAGIVRAAMLYKQRRSRPRS
jgi:uncharacterized membrane protein